jgi:polyisoprenoid-binding protein YceI
VFLSFLSLFIPNGVTASEWKLDTAHSGIYFEINHIYAATRGYFKKYEGKIFFDPNNLGSSSFDFKVKVKSVDTGNSKRDGHIQNKEFFYSKKYPFMSFKSTSIKQREGNKYIAEGTMTVKDVSQNIAVPFKFFGIRSNPFADNSEVAGFEARLTIDRLEYNVGNGKYYEMGTIGKDVEVLISFEALRKK